MWLYNSHSPIKIGGATWAILSEIDKAEAYTPVYALPGKIVSVAIIGAVLIIGVALLFTLSIEKPIRSIFAGLKTLSSDELADTTRSFRGIIEGLASGAGQVSSASEQLSSSSQSMSEGASEQASSLEEISSSLEELASMTKQNSENAAQADRYSNECVESIRQLREAMGSIKNASDETAKL